ncbi:MAG TPA: NAD(P)-dependent oxidoreductase [Dyella sp.]|uniref:NAD-dependent epimerase/dehydratase family protein n=1 Tax=Dyella sp. TaxID=1869338 RepID=UPI002F95D5CE
MTRILLTGGTGFIGVRLLSHLNKAGIEVISLGRSPLRSTWMSNVDHRIVPALRSEAIRAVLSATDNCDAIVHLAAAGVNPGDRDPRKLNEINAALPSDLVFLADDFGMKAVVMMGSSSEYARCDSDLIAEDSSLETQKIYGATKAAGALAAVAAGVALNITTVNLRTFNVIGPGEASHRLLPSLYDALRAGEAVPLSAGNQVRDFIHVDDACRAVLTAVDAALADQLPSGHYNLCTGRGHSVREFASQVVTAMSMPASLLRFGELPLRADDLPRVVGDPQTFASYTGWHPEYSFNAAIEQAVAELLSAKSAFAHD